MIDVYSLKKERDIYKSVVNNLKLKLKETKCEEERQSITKKINYSLGIITGLNIAIKAIHCGNLNYKDI